MFNMFFVNHHFCQNTVFLDWCVCAQVCVRVFACAHVLNSVPCVSYVHMDVRVHTRAWGYTNRTNTNSILVTKHRVALCRLGAALELEQLWERSTSVKGSVLGG
jgi:hypothetical protein